MAVLVAILELLLLDSVNPLEKFIHKYFFHTTIVLINTNFDNLDEKLSFVLNLNQPKVIIDPKNSPDLQSFNNYLIAESNLSNIWSSVNLLKYKINTRGNFLIILQNNYTEDVTKYVFNVLWSFYIYNVVVYTNWSFFTWYPYHFKNLCGSVVNLVPVKSLHPYKNKIPKHLGGCAINVTWDIIPLGTKTPFNKTDPGYDIRLLDSITQSLNISALYLSENGHYNRGGKRGYGSLREDMIRRRIDVALLLIDSFESLGPEFELSQHYFETYCFFILPPRRKILSSTDTLLVFSVEVWSIIFASLILMIVVWKNMSGNTLETSIIQIIGMVLQGTIQNIPRTISKRLIVAIFYFYTLNLNWIYLSQLSGILSKPSYEPKITTIKQLALSNKKLRFIDVFARFFAGREVYDKLLEKRIKPFKTFKNKTYYFYEELEDFLTDRSYGIVTSDTRILFIKNHEVLHKVYQEQSLGVVLYVLVCGSLPFDGRTLHDLRNVVIEGKFRIPYFMSQDCEYLIRHMLVVDPDKRLTMTQIAKHRWLANTPPVDTGPERELQLNKTVIDHMLQLPNLNQNMVLQSLKNNTFDHIHAIYNLLLDKLHQRTINFQSKISQQRRLGSEEIVDYLHTRPPKINERSESFNEQQLVTQLASEASQGAERQVDESFNYRRESFNENCLRREEAKERRKSINESISEDGGSPFVSMPTIPAVYLVDDGDNQPLEKFKEMDQDASEEACSLSVPSSSTTGYGSCSSSGDKYLTVRRHTVGPGDSAHEQVLETHYMAQAQQDSNGTKLLPHTNLPLHLPILGQQNPHYFGGKDPHLLKPPTVLNAAGGFGRRASDGGANLHMAWGTPGSHEQLSIMSTSSSGNPSLSSGTVTQPLEQPALDELAAVQRYMQGRGNAKRHTMANPEEVHSLQSASGSGVRTRRTGLLTVMERPPVIPPEVVMEVEARMKRNHVPPMLTQRKHSRHAVKPHLPTVQELQGREPKSMERFSPVRRGSEGSASGSRTLSPSTPQQECQRLQRGLQARSSPPRSIPGSPIHQLVSDSQIRHQMTDCPSPIHQFYSTDPSLGPSPESYQSNFASSPLHSSPFGTNPSSNLNSPIQQNLFGQVPNLTMYSGTTSPIMNPLLSPSTSPVFGSYVPTPTAPGSISSITQGISGLNTTGAGSITQGTPSTSLQLEIRNQQMQEDKMDTSYSSLTGFQPNFLHQSHHMHHILNIHNHRSLTNSPISNPGSPGLDMIQEELPHMHSMVKNDQQNVGHPQISVTDVLGSEVTLVAGSDTSEDSMDSLDNQKIPKIPSFVISEPSENLPSITKGIGRKTSQENEESAKFFSKPQESEPQESEFFLRRNSDKSSVYSDDSLSNDSLSIGNQSPSSSSNTQSSHACDSDIRLRPVDNSYEKMQISQELSNSGAGNFQIFQNYRMSEDFHDTNMHKNSGSFEFELSEVCSKLQSTDILEMVKRTINDQIPPKTYSSAENVSDRLSLEYEGGIQIELKVIDKQKDSKGLKMRRISGDHLVYNQLCQQLISCMTVS